MSAHIVITGLGEEPATVNPAAIRLLRAEGFDGVVLTDALDMAAIRDGIGSGEGAVQAILAGADLLCLGNPGNREEPEADWDDFRQVRDSLARAVEQGRISLTRLAESARRIATMGGLPALPPPSPLTVDWLELATSACLSASANPAGAPPEAGVHCLQSKPSWRLVDLRTEPNAAAGYSESYFARELATIRAIHELPAGPTGTDIAVVDALYPGSEQAKSLAELLNVSPGLVCINAGLPLDRTFPAHRVDGTEPAVPSTAVVLNCFGASPLCAQAVARILGGS